ncbi:MAG: hypothetical protein AAGB51_04290 [Planctomycetota bacterium]
MCPAEPQLNGASPSPTLDLTGDLPCVGCRYNLKGLSISSDCPECGLRIGATVLAVVDPYASELVPLRAPARTGRLLLLWVGGGLLAACALWTTHAAESLAQGSPQFREIADALRPLASIGLLLSMFGSLAFIRPHSEVPWNVTAAALLGCLLYIPLIYVQIQIQFGFDAIKGPPYLTAAGPPSGRSLMRLLWAASLLGLLLALRPSARLLASRSTLMRSGVVDRQTMLTTAAVVLVSALGDVAQLGAGFTTGVAADTLRLVGVMLVGTGSVLISIALVNIAVDIKRLWPVVARHPIKPANLLARRTGGEPVSLP